jgi:hypothetical protein
MAKLYIFGDSYSTPDFCVSPQDSWWGQLAQDMSLPVINYSWPGNNLESIAHIIVSQNCIFEPNDAIVIGVPPIDRFTVFDTKADIKHATVYDAGLTHRQSQAVLCHDSLCQLVVHEQHPTVVDRWNRSWAEAQAMTILIALAALLKNTVDRFLILNLSEPFQPQSEWHVIKSLQNQIYADSRFMLDKNTYYSCNYQQHRPVDFDSHGWFGHHGAAGNTHWYQHCIHPALKNLGWI